MLTCFFAFTRFKNTPACIVSLPLTDKLYIGVNNPLSILVRGVPEEQVVVTTSGSGAILEKIDGIRYNLRVNNIGETRITVSEGDSVLHTFRYTVSRIPDPVVFLGGKRRPQSIESGEFKAQTSLSPVLKRCEYDGICEIVGFEVTRSGTKGEPVPVRNKGARFNADLQKLIAEARPGDTYFFDNIKVKCPGDQVSRANISPLSFNIK